VSSSVGNATHSAGRAAEPNVSTHLFDQVGAPAKLVVPSRSRSERSATVTDHDQHEEGGRRDPGPPSPPARQEGPSGATRSLFRYSRSYQRAKPNAVTVMELRAGRFRRRLRPAEDRIGAALQPVVGLAAVPKRCRDSTAIRLAVPGGVATGLDSLAIEGGG
jgi:hypothetical protein